LDKTSLILGSMVLMVL